MCHILKTMSGYLRSHGAGLMFLISPEPKDYRWNQHRLEGCPGSNMKLTPQSICIPYSELHIQKICPVSIFLVDTQINRYSVSNSAVDYRNFCGPSPQGQRLTIQAERGTVQPLACIVAFLL